jgi:DNA-binding transcriptional ArsR family regulator
MKQKRWMFLSNHGHVFTYITKHPKSTAEETARKINLSMRGVQNILADLNEAGYLEKVREGRSNSYIVHPELPMRHRLERQHAVGDMLHALGCDNSKKVLIKNKSGRMAIRRI